MRNCQKIWTTSIPLVGRWRISPRLWLLGNLWIYSSPTTLLLPLTFPFPTPLSSNRLSTKRRRNLISFIFISGIPSTLIVSLQWNGRSESTKWWAIFCLASAQTWTSTPLTTLWTSMDSWRGRTSMRVSTKLSEKMILASHKEISSNAGTWVFSKLLKLRTKPRNKVCSWLPTRWKNFRKEERCLSSSAWTPSMIHYLLFDCHCHPFRHFWAFMIQFICRNININEKIKRGDQWSFVRQSDRHQTDWEGKVWQV